MSAELAQRKVLEALGAPNDDTKSEVFREDLNQCFPERSASGLGQGDFKWSVHVALNDIDSHGVNSPPSPCPLGRWGAG